MVEKTKLLLCLCIFALTIVNVRLQNADCSSCPTDATGCDITEETTGDTMVLITTVKCKRGDKNVGEFQNSVRNPNPGTHSKRTFHRSHTSRVTYNTGISSQPVWNTIQQPAFQNQQYDRLQQIQGSNAAMNSGQAGSYVIGSDGFYQRVGGLNPVVDPYFDPTYAQRHAQEEFIRQRQAAFHATSNGKQGTGFITADQNGRYIQAGGGFPNGQSPTSRCDPCPFNAVGCNIHEETTRDTTHVVTTTTCLDNTNRKISEVRTTKVNPSPGSFFARTFYESHGSIASHY